MARRLCGESDYPPGLVAVAAHRLRGAAYAFPGPAPVADDAWTALLDGAAAHRVTGLLAAAVRDGAVPTTAGQASAVAAAHRSAQLRAMGLEQQLVAVTGLLAAEGLDVRALKGPAVAHLDYPDPGLRSFVDLDVLVRASEIDRVVAVLSDAGFRRTLPEPRPGFDRRFDKGLTMLPPAGYELDVHRTFVLGPWGRLVDLDALWGAGQEFRVAGTTVTALARPHRFLHACYHAALGDWPLRLGSLRDVAEMLRVLETPGGAAEAVRVREIAAGWGVEAVVAAAVADTGRLLGGDRGALTEWALGHVPNRRDERWLALHTHPDKTFAAQALATLRVLPRWRDRAAYVYALTLPDPGYTVGRHRSMAARLAYAVAQVRRGRRPGS
jgi:hypothetical protein